MLKKKRMTLISLCATACLALSVGAGVGLNQTTATANGNNLFAMENGASLKISEDGGIRFRVKMDEAQKNYVTQNENVTLHFLVAPHEFYNAVSAEDGVKDYYGDLAKKKVIDVDETKIYEEDGYYWANGCVTNVLEVNRNLDFTLLAYTYDASTQTIAYADANIATVRGSLTDVLSQAVVYTDAEDTSYTQDVFACGAYTWFGTEEYPIQVNNLATYNNLVAKINGGTDFSNYTVSVLDTVPTEGRAELTDGKTLTAQRSYMVKFLNADGTLYKKYIVADGATLTVPANLADISAQYTFAGWDADEDGVADEVETNVSESVTYKAVYAKQYDSVPNGTTKISVADGYYQAVVGLPTNFAVNTAVNVEMDIYVTGSYNENSNITSVNMVWSTSGGEARTDKTIVDNATMSANQGKWIHVSFGAMVRDYKVLRLNSAYPTIDTSAYGNAVFLLASDFRSAQTFNYKNVVITQANAAPVGTEKTSGANGYYQSALGLPTQYAVGTAVTVEMDVFVTGDYDQYTNGIYWVDTVYTTTGGEIKDTTKVLDYATIDANEGKWIHLSFGATVRDFDVLRLGTPYGIADVSSYGNAVFLVAHSFKTTESFVYKNVNVKEIKSMPNGTQKTANPNGYHQSIVGLSTDLAVGTEVTVEMDIYVTGTIDQYSTGIEWIGDVWSTSGGESKNSVTIVNKDTINANAGKWIHVTFDAKVCYFTVLRLGVEYATIDMTAYGNSVYLMANGFKTAQSFNYTNVVITAK